MSLSEKSVRKYEIVSHYGELHILTAKELCTRILEDSKSDYNWIAPARELVRVCKKQGFPFSYALIIKVAILNCFANIEHKANCGGDRYITNPADKEAVEYCYNSLYGIDEEDAISARKRFLTEMIDAASYIRVFDSLYHPGPTFRNLLNEWRKTKFEEYIYKQYIDFEEMFETLRINLKETIKVAEVNGCFDDDEKKKKEEMLILIDKIIEI